MSHLHLFHTTTMNHQLKSTSHMSHLFLNGLPTTKNQLLNSTHSTDHQLTGKPTPLNLTIMLVLTVLELLLLNIGAMLKNHLHMSHTTIMNHLPKLMKNTNQPQSHGAHTTMNHQLLFSTTNQPLNHTSQKKSHLHMLIITPTALQLTTMSHTSQLQFNGLTSMKNQRLNSTTILQKLRNTPSLTSHLHMSHISTTHQKPKNMSHMNHQLLNGLLTTKNHQLISTTIPQRLKSTPLNMNHPHMFHTSTMSHPLKNTTLMSQLQFHGQAISTNQKPIFTTTNLQLPPTTQNMSHPHMFHTTTTNHPPKSTTHTSQLQFHGPISMSNHLLISTIMKNLLKLTFQNMNHLHMFHITTMNHQLKNTTLMNHPQLYGPATTMSQRPISTTTSHQLRLTSQNMNHLHTTHTSTMNHPLKSTTLMSHPQLPGLTSMKNQPLISITTSHQLNHTTLKLNHLHM
jgi:hypothetical protein